MANNWTEAQISEIVASVLKQINGSAAVLAPWDATSYGGRKFIGIYADMNDAIAAANEGYKAVRAMSVAEREKLITVIREMTREEAEVMGLLGVAETKMGRADHKKAKHCLVADKTPGTEDIEPSVCTGDHGLTLTEMAPFGVVGTSPKLATYSVPCVSASEPMSQCTTTSMPTACLSTMPKEASSAMA